MRLFLALVPQLLIVGAPAPPAFRLPDAAKPTRYELEVTIIPRQAEFRGAARITVELAKATSMLWLNAKELSVDRVSVTSQGRSFKARAIAPDEFLGLEFPSSIGPGPARIEIEYHGQMSGKQNLGLYRKNSGPDWYAYTTFTPIEARRAFPCFDEPAYKAPWRVILHVPRSDTAVSNARMISERNERDGMKRVEFAETLSIPSEVVAFAVGPFDVADAGTAGRNRVPVRVIAPKGRGGETAGAKSATADILARLEDYTGIPYPWDKLDHLAVLDMPYGAVENPGLITYRDRLLLAAPERDTPERRRTLRATMAHELAHQWFGNLVTQAWWDDVWLSEGFATWLGTRTADMEFPEFERGLAAVQARAQIMRADASPSTRPVRLPMNSRKDMEALYGGIVYQKGAAILRMLEHWIGEQPFQRGVRAYLTAHAHSTATTPDLAEALRTASGMDAASVLTSYLNRTGFPSVSVSCSDGHASFAAPGDWTTPVCVRTERGDPACATLTGTEATLPFPEGCPLWMWPNRDGAGYFRLAGDDKVWEHLFKDASRQLAAPERLSMVDDFAALVAGAKISGDTIRAVVPLIVRDPSAAVANAGYKLFVSALASSSPPEREKFEETLKKIGAVR